MSMSIWNIQRRSSDIFLIMNVRNNKIRIDKNRAEFRNSLSLKYEFQRRMDDMGLVTSHVLLKIYYQSRAEVDVWLDSDPFFLMQSNRQSKTIARRGFVRLLHVSSHWFELLFTIVPIVISLEQQSKENVSSLKVNSQEKKSELHTKRSNCFCKSAQQTMERKTLSNE